MSKVDVCKALYALPGGVVVQRRKSFLKPFIVFVVGILLLGVNAIIPGGADYVNLKSAIVLFGATFALLGVGLMILRMGDGGLAPFHKDDGCFLKSHVLKFDKQKQAQVTQLVRSGDFEKLCALPTDEVSGVTVVVYSSPRSSFCAAQPFEYCDFELHPLCDLNVRF